MDNFQIDAITDSVIRIQSKSFSHNSSKQNKVINSRRVTTSKLILEIDEDLHLTIYDKENHVICADYTGKRKEAEKLSKEDMEQMIQEGHVVHSGDNSCSFMVTKQLFGDESIYGLGDKTGFLDKKGYDFEMWNSDNPDPHVENPTFKAMYKSFPFFIVLRDSCVYGIFLDNHNKTYFDMGYTSTEYYSFGAAHGDMDYYFFYGKTIAEIITAYTEIIGRSPLPQMWTLGYQQSRWSYSSQQEVLELAKNFRKYHIPCDAIHLDIDYMDNFKVFTTDKNKFPDLDGLVEELGKMGIKLVTIIDPGVKVEKGYHMYEEGLANNYFATSPDGTVYHNVVWPGDSVYPDFTSTKTRSWWAKQTKLLSDHNIAGIWNDMNEPASFNGPLPDDVVFPGDNAPKQHKEVHNVYGHLMAKATYQGLKENTGKRPFVITRAAYSGSGKYCTTWTGDNQSIWSHLQLAIPQLLNLGLSGMPFCGTDIGGFGSNTTPELLCRWIEACCFSPLFRNHSAKYTRRQEPWQFDLETLEINKKYIKLHYKYLPYFYDLCYEESKTGIPMLRPLVMHYQNDPLVRQCNDEYLVGDRILVAPVVTQGSRARMVYLPDDIWVDYWTGERLQGGRYIIKEAPLDICPIYIKADSVIPTWPEMESIPANGSDTLILEYYPAKPDQPSQAVYKHYQDNGTDFAYENGEYNIYEFTCPNRKNCQLTTKLTVNGYNAKYTTITAVTL